MWWISANEYVGGEAKLTKIFALYLQASGFPTQSSEYAFEWCRKQLGRYGISLSYSSPDVDLVTFFVYVDYCHRTVGVHFLQEFDVHIFYPLFLRSVLPEFAFNRRLSRTRRMRCRVGYYIICTYPWVGLRSGCGLLLNPTCSRGWFSSSVFSSLFVNITITYYYTER